MLNEPAGRRVAAREFSPAFQGRVMDASIIRRAATTEKAQVFSESSHRYATRG